MRALVKFLRLPWRDRGLVVRAFLSSSLIRAGLVLMPLQSLRAAVHRSGRRPMNHGRRPETVKIAWAVAAANRIWRGDCLPRALAAELMLRHYGYPAEFKIGAGRDPNGAFIAHAWVESEGRIVIGDFELGKYAELIHAAAPAASGSIADKI
ncbi:MAG TPA: lasso peptide biosynthesis B2 protein [Candidatus Binataceae bacterium]|nr:lasso peptide biosynthesis B2 protein [Candidatus Binataceae bacterium]